jgi:hypothetical protein
MCNKCVIQKWHSKHELEICTEIYQSLEYKAEGLENLNNLVIESFEKASQFATASMEKDIVKIDKFEAHIHKTITEIFDEHKNAYKETHKEMLSNIRDAKAQISEETEAFCKLVEEKDHLRVNEVEDKLSKIVDSKRMQSFVHTTFDKRFVYATITSILNLSSTLILPSTKYVLGINQKNKGKCLIYIQECAANRFLFQKIKNFEGEVLCVPNIAILSGLNKVVLDTTKRDEEDLSENQSKVVFSLDEISDEIYMVLFYHSSLMDIRENKENLKAEVLKKLQELSFEYSQDDGAEDSSEEESEGEC